jgi:hypothetical protein
MQIFSTQGCQQIGCGGTKSAYLDANRDLVFVSPNPVDGQALISIWPRIVSEEIMMSERVQQIGVPTLKLTPCFIKTKSDETLPSYFSIPFKSYTKEDIYIIDSKNIKSTQWRSDLSLFSQTDPFDLDAWMDALYPLICDLRTLLKNQLYFGSDTLNLAFVGSKSRWHSNQDPNLKVQMIEFNRKQSPPFEIRIFGFDFSSKRAVIDLNKKNAPLRNREIKSMLDRVIELAVWEHQSHDQFTLTEAQLKHCEVLSQICLKYLIDKTIPELETKPEPEVCIIS